MYMYTYICVCGYEKPLPLLRKALVVPCTDSPEWSGCVGIFENSHLIGRANKSFTHIYVNGECSAVNVAAWHSQGQIIHWQFLANPRTNFSVHKVQVIKQKVWKTVKNREKGEFFEKQKFHHYVFSNPLVAEKNGKCLIGAEFRKILGPYNLAHL